MPRGGRHNKASRTNIYRNQQQHHRTEERRPWVSGSGNESHGIRHTTRIDESAGENTFDPIQETLIRITYTLERLEGEINLYREFSEEANVVIYHRLIDLRLQQIPNYQRIIG